MDQKQGYIPNPQKWMQFYKGFVSGHQSSYSKSSSYHNQHGGSITASPSPFMIPIENKRGHDSDQTNEKLTLVSPVQQVVEQAKLNLKRQKKSAVYKRRNYVKKINRRPKTQQKQRQKRKPREKAKKKSKKGKKRIYRDIFAN